MSIERFSTAPACSGQPALLLQLLRCVFSCKVAYTAYWGLFILWETRRVSQPALLEDWEVQDGSRTNSGQTSELKNFSAFGSAHMLEGQATLVRDALSYVRLSAAN
eukprot:s6249_g4.t1